MSLFDPPVVVFLLPVLIKAMTHPSTGRIVPPKKKLLSLLYPIKREQYWGEYTNRGVSVVRNFKVKVEEVKASHTLGGTGELYT